MEKWKNINPSANQSSPSIRPIPCHPMPSHPCAHFLSPTKGCPPWPRGQDHSVLSNQKQPSQTPFPRTSSGGRRTVEGGGSRIDEPTPWRPTPGARYERELNSIEQKPRREWPQTIPRRDKEKGNEKGCVGPSPTWPIDRLTLVLYACLPHIWGEEWTKRKRRKKTPSLHVCS